MGMGSINPQFGRSGSQNNNLTNQGIGPNSIQCYSPIFAQQRSVPVKEGLDFIDTAMSPKQQHHPSVKSDAKAKES